MKRIGIAIMAAFVMSAALPAFAADMTKEEKNQCLLASKGCTDEVDSIQQKIGKLNKEIKKGKRVYTDEEIRKLEQKLKEANDLLDDLLKGHK
ncbi:hypothetical protein [Geotalea uraniireducens]|uniref:Uncharacterized protein n=1 Tax=Geotalea uraniireducens (strain Rf4) TaxID=351605 RepID=A5GDM0_GEOUR|nr:hypothetical protein [Geotalea uraniireducens]ABQ24325.1 hypothetical protein Gura_0109 [Geotalea uraniireducens Rf4]